MIDGPWNATLDLLVRHVHRWHLKRVTILTFVLVLSASQAAGVTEMILERPISACANAGKSGCALFGSEPATYDSDILENWSVWLLWAYSSSNSFTQHAPNARGAVNVVLVPPAPALPLPVVGRKLPSVSGEEPAAADIIVNALPPDSRIVALPTADRASQQLPVVAGRKLAQQSEQTLLLRPAAPTTIPDASITSYACTKHELPADADYHVTKIEPAIQVLLGFFCMHLVV